MNRISRKNVFKLFESMRNILIKEVDLSGYLEEDISSINMEQNEVEVDLQGVSNGFLQKWYMLF